jgi:hypothetical protein
MAAALRPGCQLAEAVRREPLGVTVMPTSPVTVTHSRTQIKGRNCAGSMRCGRLLVEGIAQH